VFPRLVNPPSATTDAFAAEFEDEYTPADALIKGLDDLSSLCGVVQDKFLAARDEFGKN